MGSLVLRVLVTSLVATGLCFSAVATPAAADDASPVPDMAPGDCAVVTFVTTQAENATVDVYIAKSSPGPDDPGSPTDPQTFVGEVVDAARAFLDKDAQPASSGGDVQVVLVFPKNEDAGTDGYRLGFIVDLHACARVTPPADSSQGLG